MPIADHLGFFIDPSRCIGCRACVQACSECDTHKGTAMIHLDYLDRAYSTQTTPSVCMHCDTPTCAEVCPADAIKKGADGIVRSALKARCLGCNNCVLACPFGVPKMNTDFDLMMKCDLCYDRTSIGKNPLCASVCPSGALFFGTSEAIEKARPRSAPIQRFQFGDQAITTKVRMMVPRHAQPSRLDVTANLYEEDENKLFSLDLMDVGLFDPDEGDGT